jgi:hypothetical protein
MDRLPVRNPSKSLNQIQNHIKECCNVAVAQINYPSFKHNTQDSIKQARGRSHEEVQVRFLC